MIESRGVVRLSIPFVGRQQEITAGNELLGRLDGGSGSLLIITGETGVGKTRLVQHLLDEARRRKFITAVGRCTGSAGSFPFEPWLDIMSNIAPDDRARIDQALGAHGDVLDLSKVIRDGIRAGAKKTPSVVVLEDVHWADDDSIELLELVAKDVSVYPILLCVTYRANELAGSRSAYRVLPVLGRDLHSDRLSLRPLLPPEVYEIARQTLDLSPSDSRGLSSVLYEKSGGNPLYVVELLRGIQDNMLPDPEVGVDTDEPPPIEELRIPAHLLQIIEARLSNLSQDVREQLEIASILGDRVQIEDWRRLTGVFDSVLMNTIRRAVDAGVLDPSDDGLEVAFHHSIIREALYESILPPVRRELHLRAAELLSSDEAPNPDAVAWHYQQAADPRAVEWLKMAADRAQRSYAWVSAASRLELAVALLRESAIPERGWLSYRIGRLLRHSDPRRSIDWLDEAMRLARLSDDRFLESICRFDRGHLMIFLGHLNTGLSEMGEAIDVLDQVTPSEFERWSEVESWIADAVPGYRSETNEGVDENPNTVADLRLGTLVQWLADAGRFHEALERGIPFVGRAADTKPTSDQMLSSLGDAWYGLARAHAAFGESLKAYEAFERAAESYERIDHHLLVAFTRRAQVDEVVIPYEPENHARVTELLRGAERALARGAGALGDELPAEVCALDSLIHMGEWERASVIARALVHREGIIEPLREFGRTRLARLEMEYGQPERAWELVMSVLPDGTYSETGTRAFTNTIYVLQVGVELALDAENIDEAQRWLSTVENWVDWSDSPVWRPALLLLKAQVSGLADNRQQALAHAEEALRLADSHGLKLEQGRARQILADLLVSERRLDEARGHNDAALALARRSHFAMLYLATRLTEAKLLFHSSDLGAARGITAELRQRSNAMHALRFLGRVDEFLNALENASGSDDRPFGLSSRELEVLRLVAEGMTDAEVADQLFISYRTVTTHLTSIFNKLGVNSRVSATRIAIENDLF